MKKKILMTMIVSVMTSLGCWAKWETYIIDGVHYEINGNTAAIIGAYNSSVISPHPICVRINDKEGVPNDTFPVTAVLNSRNERWYHNGLLEVGLSFRTCDVIDLPASVKTIGYVAMTDNDNLKRVEMPGVEMIDKEGLVGNPMLCEPIVLKELVYLGERAFAGCKKLSELRFGSKLRHIAKDAFEGCESLKVIDIGNPQTWSHVVFETTETNPIKLTKRFKVNGSEAHHLDIDMRWTCIGEHAFYSAENIRSVRIRNAIDIKESAFDRCVNLADICLDVDSIGDYAFGNNESIRRVYVMKENPPIANSRAFWNYNATLYVPKGSLEAYRTTEYCWRFFREIKESDFSEVDEIFKADYVADDSSSVESVEKDEREDNEAVDMTKPMEVYSMQGQLVSRSMEGLQPGLYIMRQGRKAKKVLVGRQ